MADRACDNPLITQAANALRLGDVVGIPTETVYGLAADARNRNAVNTIFQLKGRPSTNPLIVHIADIQTAKQYTTHWTTQAQQLATRFWPGPLTIVLPKSDAIVAEVSAGLQTVGLRVPNHPIALELLKQFDGPVAAPSANRSNRISPTTAQHVRDEFGDAVKLVLDGGVCRVGIESTVLDLSTSTPRILRPGHITTDEIAAVIGSVESLTPLFTSADAASTSPGQQRKHYAPVTPSYHVNANEVITLDLSDAALLPINLDPATYARQFYATLRMLDQQQLRAIYIELPPNSPEWQAIRDRILRASLPFQN